MGFSFGGILMLFDLIRFTIFVDITLFARGSLIYWIGLTYGSTFFELFIKDSTMGYEVFCSFLASYLAAA